jgi:3-hydroxybutyryl-CoA dehydratase
VKITVGETFCGAPILIDPEAMKLWSEVLRDPNPIHRDPAAVRAMGLGDRVINPGPANAAFVINALLAQFRNARLEHFSVRFLDNLFGGETAIATGIVTAVETPTGRTVIHCDIALDASGRTVLTGSAVIGIGEKARN